MDFVLKEIEKELDFSFPAGTVFSRESGRTLTVERKGKKVFVNYTSHRQLFRAAALLKAKNGDFTVEETEKIEDVCLFLDCSRNAVYTVETVKKLIRNAAAFGYNCMSLYIEDTYEIDGEPLFGYLRGRYTKAELKEIDDYSFRLGIEVFPTIQTLGHLEHIAKFGHYGKLFDKGNVLFVGEENVYAFIEKMFAAMRECFRSKKCEIGVDEAVDLGLGKYLDKNGYRDKLDILIEHLKRVCEIAQRYAFRPIACTDMFWYLEKKKQGISGEEYPVQINIPPSTWERLPQNIELLYWEYGSFDKEQYKALFKKHKETGKPVWFHACSWKWGSMLPSNFMTLKHQTAAIDAIKEENINHIINACYGDNGAEAAIFSVLPGICYFGLYAMGYNMDEIKEQFFAVSGVAFDDFMKLELPNSYGEYRPFAGHTAKLMAYNDLFLGVIDADIDYSKKAEFKRCADELNRLANGQYGYLFDFASKLSDLLYTKHDLGKNLREAYKADDKNRLSELLKEIYVAIDKAKALHRAFRKQWLAEAKPHGFDVQDIRMGGMIGRMTSCAERLNDYLNGELKELPELNETIISKAICSTQEGGTFFCPTYSKVASVNTM